MVYTGFPDDDCRIALKIHVIGRCTEDHLSNAFLLDQQNSIVELKEEYSSKSDMVEEHGWFQDVKLFTAICQNQPVPNQQNTQPASNQQDSQPASNQQDSQHTLNQQDNLFEKWRSAVLSTIKRDYATLWVPNDNTV